MQTMKLTCKTTQGTGFAGPSLARPLVRKEVQSKLFHSVAALSYAVAAWKMRDGHMFFRHRASANEQFPLSDSSQHLAS